MLLSWQRSSQSHKASEGSKERRNKATLQLEVAQNLRRLPGTPNSRCRSRKPATSRYFSQGETVREVTWKRINQPLPTKMKLKRIKLILSQTRRMKTLPSDDDACKDQLPASEASQQSSAPNVQRSFDLACGKMVCCE